MYHSRPTDLIIGCIAVGLENAFELSQEPLRPIASATRFFGVNDVVSSNQAAATKVSSLSITSANPATIRICDFRCRLLRDIASSSAADANTRG
jgi:hypothetical protein